MKRNLIFGTVFAAAMAVGAAAQTPSSQTPSSQTPSTQPPSSQMPSSSQKQSEKSGQTITVTGCLQSAEGGSVGTTGTGAPGASTRASADNFILADATMGSAPSAAGAAGEKAPGAAGTTGAPGASAAGTTYRLVGGDKGDLKKYVNSQVEIRGRLDSSGGAGAAAGGAMGGTSARPGASGQQLHVESVRQIASSCTK